jgi:Immunoglobulin I-set domain
LRISAFCISRVLPCAVVAAVFLAGCGGGSGGSATTPTSPTPPTATAVTITVPPADQTVTAGQTATFSVTATGTAPITYQWQKNGSNIAGATAGTYTTPATATTDSGAKFDVVVTNSVGSVTSGAATLTVNAIPIVANITDVTTYHYDNLRTGQNLNETTLTLTNVNQTKFGLLGSYAVDGKVDGQPLFLGSVNIAGKGMKNVLYVVTEHDSVFAFDADANSGSASTALWTTSVLGSGETSSDDRGCGQVSPEVGITSTPVIDRSRNAIYVVAVSKDSKGNYTHRIHGLDLTTGKELFGGPTAIAATYPGTGANSSNGSVVFDPTKYNERPGLLQVGAAIYTTWGSHCDSPPYTGWVMSYSADTLKQVSVLDLVPNGNDGGIWMSGAAPAADAAGNVYFIVGNGDFGTALSTSGFPANGNCGNCFVKVSAGPPIKLLDYFTPLNTVSESNGDTDFGSGGPLLLPDMKDATGATRHLAVGAGKDGLVFVVDRDNMGKFNASKNSVYQQIVLAAPVFSKPSYFNNTVYYGGVSDSLRAYPIAAAKLPAAAASQTGTSFGYPGTSPTISANGTANGIVWAVENASPGVLHAYDAINLATEIYNSNQAAAGRDNFAANKYITPVVTNGRVFVGTPTSVAVFGLLP